MNADWIVIGGKAGELAHCTRCGVGLPTTFPLAINDMTKMLKDFEKGHRACKPVWQEPKPKSEMEWLAGRDTGTSSKTIFAAATGIRMDRHDLDIPYDPDDFGRCYRLVRLFPRMRPTEPIIRRHLLHICPAWAPFIDAWDQMVELWEEESLSGQCPKLYELMQQLRKRQVPA